MYILIPLCLLQIPPELFDRALLKRDREKFLDLFMEKKTIVLHQYLNHKKLLYLFNQLEKPEFFCHICLEGVLAKIPVRYFVLLRCDY